MGKSGKKIKSDRINTLRKQYDAFLKDDKKRKDRNDYILGRLEEIRSSSALVTIQHKENSHANNNYYSSRGMTFWNYPSQVDNFKNRSEPNGLKTVPNKTIIANDFISHFEPSLLREISKKYILIPRQQSCYSNEVNYPLTESADTDWKSKYNILNELKKSEKEKVSDNVIFEEPQKSIAPVQESLNKHDNKTNGYIKTKDNVQDLNVDKYKNYEESNKLNSNNNEKINLNCGPDLNVQNIGGKQTHKIYNEHLFHHIESIGQFNVPNNTIPGIEVSEKQTKNKSEVSKNMEDYYNNQNCHIPQSIEHIEKNEIREEVKEKNNLGNFENESSEEKHNLEENVNQEIKDNFTHNVDRDKITNDDRHRHLSENLEDDFKNVVKIHPELDDVENYKSNEAPIISDETGNPEIIELENEQNQMFYTEDSNNKYDYMENNADAEVYPIENENYTNEQYSYHDESQLEQPYASEINEHEETTEQYDPNYEQHYTNNYENMNVPQYDDQQYEINNSYENQQNPQAPNVNYEEIQPNNETFENIVPENTEISYQNQDDNVYDYGNKNYESQQYDTNEQKEYSPTDHSEQGHYAIEQEYVQSPAEQDTVNDVEKVLDTEDGYVDNQNTILTTYTENNIAPDISSIEPVPNVNVS